MQDCRINNNSFIDDKTSIKNTHIGQNVTIESKTRISQSVLMEAVTIRQRYYLNNLTVFIYNTS